MGKLFVIATPIGNLEDITARAVRILTESDIIAAEDTRHTRRLLTHLGITGKQMVSYHGHNEEKRTNELLRMLEDGKSVALVSDAGTPAISDPGYRIVRAARDAQHEIEPIPGACALITALSAAGLPTTRFTFVGFLPEKRGRRTKLLESLADLPHTIAMYVARWDVKKYLAELQAVMGNREAVVCRELTKKFEEFKCGTITELHAWAEQSNIKGEITLLISGSAEK